MRQSPQCPLTILAASAENLEMLHRTIMLAYRRLWRKPYALLRYKSTSNDMDLTSALHRSEAFSNITIKEPTKPKFEPIPKQSKAYTADITKLLSKEERRAIHKVNKERKGAMVDILKPSKGSIVTKKDTKPVESEPAYSETPSEALRNRLKLTNANKSFEEADTKVENQSSKPKSLSEPEETASRSSLESTNANSEAIMKRLEKISTGQWEKNTLRSTNTSSGRLSYKSRRRSSFEKTQFGRTLPRTKSKYVGSSSSKSSDSKDKTYTKSNSPEDEVSLMPRSEYSSLVESGTINIAKKELRQVSELKVKKIPTLAHNLDRVLFSPGVHFLQDPRTRVYNFPPNLKKITKYDDFNFDALSGFVRVSRDETLLKASIENNAQFYSSTSSMTGALIEFYMLLNNYDPSNYERFNFKPFKGHITKAPASLFVEPRGKNSTTNKTIYSVETDSSCLTEILLSAMGHCLEAFLTTDDLEYQKNYLKSSQNNKKVDAESIYNYSKCGDFLMRSQLDCYDERLPGNGTFDLKTRAVCSVRYDSLNSDIENKQYQIFKQQGKYESFSREYDDLITTGAMLKYMFQARIGQMDGIFLAYHNLNSIFGFQYLPLEEIDRIFYSHKSLEFRNTLVLGNNTTKIDIEKLADQIPSIFAENQFVQSMKLWESLLKKVIEDINDENQSFRLIFKSVQDDNVNRLEVIAVPISTNEITKLKEFSTRFETSFKHDITKENRANNLTKHAVELTKFNTSLMNKIPGKKILGYYIDINEQVIGEDKYSQDKQPYPWDANSKWTMNYKIHKYDNKKTEDQKHLKLLLFKMLQPVVDGISSRTLTNDRPDALKLYEQIGKARAKMWSNKDNNPVIYKPKN